MRYIFIYVKMCVRVSACFFQYVSVSANACECTCLLYVAEYIYMFLSVCSETDIYMYIISEEYTYAVPPRMPDSPARNRVSTREITRGRRKKEPRPR